MSDYSSDFSRLDTILQTHSHLWQYMPFAYLTLPWQESHPEFCAWLMALTEEQVEELKTQPASLLSELIKWFPELEAFSELTELSRLPMQEHQPLPRGLDTGIPGRKWHQITAFNQAMPALDLPWLEWCAGKGHLGRVLAASHQTPVVSLEWQKQLCEDGEVAAKRLGLPIRFVHGDAFAPESAEHICEHQHAVALHACGDLHVSLLKQVANKKGQAVSISPCCYHLIRDKQYQPMSELAKQSELTLTKHDLRLPLQETVTAGKRVRDLRFVEVSFRLGFDSLQRSLSDSGDYIPVPNVQKALLGEGFESFCLWAAEKKGIALPADIDFAHWQKQGEQRFMLVERMELMRQIFRRPLEMWLVLDRVCYLEEHGYQVQLGTFCDKPITPRNILIHGHRI